ncbi:hypothetical protein Tco_1269213, partial [Tanacetum coccineum]
LFYRSQLNRFSKHDVYSPLKILSVLYKFKEGDFVNLHLNDIKDMLLLVVQHKLFHLDGEVSVDLAVALRMFTEVSSSRRESKMSNWVWKVTRRSSISPSLKRTFLHAHKRRLGIMVDWIDKHMLERQILRNLERLVGVRKLKMDYKLMQRTV